MLPDEVAEWCDHGRYVDSAHGRIFVRTAPGTGPTVLFLHGYPSSSFDFRHVVTRLGGRPWTALDLLGFGLSAKPATHRYSLLDQADLISQIVGAAGPVVIVAHDMGTSVATELIARDIDGALPFELEAAVLSNGSVILERASLRPIQKVLRGPFGPVASRLITERMFRRAFGRLFSSTHPLEREEARAQWALIRQAGGNRLSHRSIGYLDERIKHATRWHGAIRDWRKPLGFLWALEDPVATTDVLEGLVELRSNAPVVELPGLGHYPQIEDPVAYATGLDRLLRQVSR